MTNNDTVEDMQELAVPDHAHVVIPDCAFLVRRWLCPNASATLGSQIVDETHKRWFARPGYGERWDSSGHHMARFADPGVTYTYKDKAKPMHEFTPGLNQVRTHLVKSLGWIPNCVVINSYTPKSGIYPHRDGKYIPQLGDTPIIASVSFGATRTFNLFPADPKTNKRIKNKEPVAVKLEDGDLFVMHGQCDRLYHHGIPAEPEAAGARISLTFRRHLL